MNKSVKIGLVAAGYLLAALGAAAATAIQVLTTQGAAAQASAGMYAFGDAILCLGVFGVLALAPTLLAFFFLRSAETLWTGFAAAGLVFSITAPVVAVVNTLINASGGGQSGDLGLLLSLAGIVRAFGEPVLVVGFLILAVMAPSGRSRLFLLIAAGLEMMAGVYVLVNFLLWRRFF